MGGGGAHLKLTSVGGTGPAVVKLAGIAGGTGFNVEEMEVAAAAGFRVAAVDTTGDRHDDPPRGPLTWDGLADDVASGIETMAEGRAVLWGTSFGCMVALATAVRRPERVAGLLLCNPPDPRWQPRFHRAMYGWALHRGDPDQAARWLFAAFFLTATSWEASSPFLWRRVPRLIRASREARTPATTVRQKIDLLWHAPIGYERLDGNLPIAIVTGQWDLVAPARGARRLAAVFPRARLTEIAAAGHSVAYARPRAYREAVITELKAMTAPSPVPA